MKKWPDSLERVRVNGEIGDDPAELEAIADAVVRGCSICYARIKSLRGLIDAVQRHPDAKLAPPANQRGEDWNPPPRRSPIGLTYLGIYGGEIADDGDYRDLDARITLVLTTHFVGDARFYDTQFGGDADFYEARFGGDAGFTDTRFSGNAQFGDARFGGNAGFDGASFGEYAEFDRARFGGDAIFDGASIGRDVIFARAWFAGSASFAEASFASSTSFDRACFAGRASFDGAIYRGRTWSGGGPWFGLASFAGAISGDLRPCFLRTARFAITATRFQRRHTRHEARRKRRGNSTPPKDLYGCVVRLADAVAQFRDWLYALRVTRFGLHPTRWLVTLIYVTLLKWPRATWHGLRYEFGWRTVRALGQLQILNRISIVAIIAVPVLAALTAVLQVQFPQWPSLGHSVALAFFAAVFVTLGLLLYQIFAPDSVRKHDEDEFIELQHKRYHEKAEDRNDGLRRAIEHLEHIAHRSIRWDDDEEDHPNAVRLRRRNAGRPDRHPNFVEHHGDTIWIPPRDRIDWFEDWEPSKTLDEEVTELVVGEQNRRMGKVPGAERARITIEEGAKAEYWLKSREKVAGAWLSFILYLIGIGCLLVIIVIQSIEVGEAAGWWGVE